MQSKLTDLLSDVCSIQYSFTLNKREYRQTHLNCKVCIKSINGKIFLGFDNTLEYEIIELGLISTNVLDMAGDSMTILEIPNLQTNLRI